MDLLGTLSDFFSSNPLSTKPEKSTGPEADPFAANTGFGASDVTQQVSSKIMGLDKFVLKIDDQCLLFLGYKIGESGAGVFTYIIYILEC